MNIIVIAHKYSPYNRVGGIRWINLVDHLSRMGNTVHVITVPRANHKAGDIINVSDSLNIYYSKSDKYYKLFESPPKKFLSQIIVYGLQKVGSFIWYDDNGQYWYKHLKKNIISILSQFPESIVIATGSPFQACYHTMRICEEINHDNYVLDFQDPWSIDPYRSYPFKWMKNKVKDFERRTLFKSKNNIYVTNGLKKLMEKKNTNAIIVENGHDFNISSERPRLKKSKKTRKFIYLGTLANGRDRVFINFLSKLVLKNSEIFHIDVFGRSSRFFKRWTKKNSLKNVNISFKNPINRAEISSLSINYNYGLQLNSEKYPYLVSTKIYEYPALGLPVLSVNGGGQIEEIIKINQIGISVNINEENKFFFDDILVRLDEIKNSSLSNYSKQSSWLSRAREINNYLNDTFK